MTATIICILTAIASVFKPLPEPQIMETHNAAAFMYHELRYVSSDTGYPVMGEMLDALPHEVQKGKGVTLSITETDVPESEEGYVLETGKYGASIKARSWKGLFYGCATLEQYLQDSRDNQVPVPVLKITDFPDLEYRAIYIDTKHHLDRIENYYRIIDKIASYKINGVIWEIEDKLGYTRHPEVASPTHISKQEMQAICRYAEERNVSISPLIQGLGHASYILKHHWELRENPLSDWEFCPSNPATYEFQFDMYEDALEAMPYGKYLHIGGDEITAIGIDDRCIATGKSSFELQMDWLKKVCDFAVEHGRTPIFWDDMVFKYADLFKYINTRETYTEEDLDKVWDTSKLDSAIDLFPKECIYMRWLYQNTTNPGNIRALQWYKEKGLKVIGACGANGIIMPINNGRLPWIKGFDELAVKYGMSGMLCTSWEDASCHFDTMMRGFLAHAQYSWNIHGYDLAQYSEAYAQREFGRASAVDFLPELENAFRRYYDIFTVRGSRARGYATMTNYVLIDLPSEEKGAWCKKYAEKLDSVKQSQATYAQIRSNIQNSLNQVCRGRYTIEVYDCLNELQNYTTELMLALERYDKGEAEDKSEIVAVCKTLPELRRHIMDVYQVTRHMSNPAGYIQDLNHHNHLAARANDDSWMYYYEIPFTKKVLEWAAEESSCRFQGKPIAICGDNKLIVADVERSNEDNLYVLWSWTTPEKDFFPLDECKPIDNWHKILLTSSTRGAAILDTDTGKMLFRAQTPNAHSIEMLPNNRVAVMLSYSPTGNCMNIYDLDKPEKAIIRDTMYAAHGAVWNAERNSLYTLDYNLLREYKLVNWNSDAPSVNRVNEWTLPGLRGHDLSPVDDNHMLVTDHDGTYMFEISSGCFTPFGPVAGMQDVKSINYDPESGTVSYTKGEIDWWTHHIYLNNPDKVLTIDTMKVYKARFLTYGNPR